MICKIRRVPGRAVLVGVVVTLGMFGVAACQDERDLSRAPASPGPDPVLRAAAVIDVQPADGATGVAPDAGIQVVATSGTLSDVTVSWSDRELVGELSADRTRWTAGQMMAFATLYTVTVAAVDDQGAVTNSVTTFTTVRPRTKLHTAVVPLDGEMVGVGLPIQVAFTAPVMDREAVQRGLAVQSSPAVTGAWRWISDDKVRYRPREYWPPGTKVTLRIRLRGVSAGAGVYGDEQRTVSFTVGRSVVSVVDARRLRMEVFIDGQVARTIPVTTGKRGWETRNGVKVTLEKHPLKVMDGATLGIPVDSPEYYRLPVRWAVRMTWSGEFVHGAEWSTADQGRARVSHGCVGMNLRDAKWFFAQTRRGDVIEVVNSPTSRSMELDNGFGDWNLSWEQWLAS